MVTFCQHSDCLVRGIMRSFTSCPATEMERLVWLSLLLSHLPATESCISQPNETIWGKTGQIAVLHCNISEPCLAGGCRYQWFAFNQSKHFRLDLEGDKYKLDGASLHIKSLEANDSGIYHCAVASQEPKTHCRQYVGMGTSLVVREQAEIKIGYILLSLLVLLVVYSLVIVTLVVRKGGCKTSIHRKMSKTDKNNSSKKMQFRDVLQEMYSRRNLEKSKQTARGNASHIEAANSELDCSTDDIYQNV
ncbi:immunoglobulin superfamily member 6 [Acanthochromis polyacanthus]|uniref:immunoglobulin superfamily member 6 n=1 Tax=Acanthochromis polyacanthus TaxID=80966 RepID=UPI0022345B65|nr:immunoglobulin superfamily member 6 [Acanthochromis polyacanthus]